MDYEWVQNNFRKYARTVYYTVKAMVQNEQTAEDIVQEVFIELFSMKRQHFENDSKVRSWLLKVATNKTLNYLKREKKFSYVASDFFDNIDTNLQTNPEAQLTEKELIQEIKKALKSLPDGFREVVLLYYYTGLTYDEISRILNIPLGTVKSRLSRAASLLRKHLHRFSEENEKKIGVTFHERRPSKRNNQKGRRGQRRTGPQQNVVED